MKVKFGALEFTPGVTRHFRLGKSVDADEVFGAWTSRNLARMRAALSLHTNPVDRALLLQVLFEELYRLRSDPVIHAELFNLGCQFVRELPRLLAGLYQQECSLKRHQHDIAVERARRKGLPPPPPPDMGSIAVHCPLYFAAFEVVLIEAGELDLARTIWDVAETSGFATQADIVDAELRITELRRQAGQRAS